MKIFTISGLAAVLLAGLACRDATTPTQGPMGNFNMGEKAQVGSFIYTIYDPNWAISLGKQPTPRIPSNRFLILSVSVVNSGNNPISIPTLTLIDDAGQAYQELDNGEGVPNWLGLARRLRPAESAQGTVAFDVPQKRFHLRIADEDDRFALVDIPLNLGETAPPGAAER